MADGETVTAAEHERQIAAAERRVAELERKLSEAEGKTADLLVNRRRLKAQIEELEATRPAKDATVLSADDATHLQALTANGRSLADVVREMAKAGELAGRVRELEGQQAAGEAGQEHGYKASVLARLLSQDRATLVRRDVAVTGEDGKRETRPEWAVQVEGQREAVSLAEYAERQWSDFLPALTTEAARASAGTAGTQEPMGGAEDRTRMLSQRSGTERRKSLTHDDHVAALRADPSYHAL